MRPRDLAVATWERGMDTIGVADRDGLYGMVRLAEACTVVGVRQLIGADLGLVDDVEGAPARVRRREARPGWEDRRARDGHAGPGTGSAWLERDLARVVVLARTQQGYANLCRLVGEHHLGRDRGDPAATWAQLERRLGLGGCFVLLGDSSPVGRLLDAGRPDAAAAEARRWMDLVGPSSVLIGVTHHLAPGDDARARRRFALADRLGLRAVAHQAARYLTPRDALVADVLDAVREQIPLRSPDGPAWHQPPRDPSEAPALRPRRRNAEGYLKDGEEMAQMFRERLDACANTVWVAERCDVDLGLGRLRVPDFVGSTSPLAELRGRCEAGLHDRYRDVGTAHRDLLARELAMVDELGLAAYFLTVAEVVDRIREKQIMVACRGSAAGSIITYALRISDVDPIAHDLAFERFMNPYRDELPDIDIDVEAARREDVYRDLVDRYGEERVVCVAMVDTFKARMAIREVGKVLGLPPAEIDHIAKSFPHVRARDVRPALEHLPELAGSNLDHPQLQLLFDVVERLDGIPRHLALHPCGVLLGDDHLRDLVPVERSAHGFAMAQLDKDDVEALGLCKLDILAVRMLSSMAHAVEEARRVRGDEIDFDEVVWNDEPTYELIRSTRTLGMFQIESPGQRELVGKFQPEHLSDLVVDISLFRPGPVKGDMVNPFLERRHRAQAAGGGSARDVVYPHPILERALGETYGVIVYHEQVMRCVAAVTGCDMATADLVRRRLGDPDELPALKQWVLTGARERGVPDEVTESLWHALTQFASFGFCKAHAAAFSVPTYRSAWLKRHHMPEFVAGLLTHDPGMYPRRLLLDDARQFAICVLPLDVNRSDRVYRVERVPAGEALARLGAGEERLPPGWRRDAAGALLPPAGLDLGVDPDDPARRFGIRLGLQDVAGIDDAQIDSLLAARPFTSIEDLRRRSALSRPVAESLAHVGALDELEPDLSRRDLLLAVGERWSGLTRHRPADPSAPEQLGLLAAERRAGLSGYRASEQVRAELEVLGLDATTHVIRFYDGLLDRLAVTRAVDLLGCRDGQRVRIAGVKVATQTPPVKSGQRIIFLSMDDATGVSDATFFESVHDRCAWTVFHTWLLVVEGTVHRTGRRGVSLNAERVWDLRRLMQAWREGWLDDALREQGPASAQQARKDHDDEAPSEGIRGAAGRSGLRLDGGGRGEPQAGGDMGDPLAQPRAVGQPFHDARQVTAELRAATGRPDAGQVNGKALDDRAARTHERVTVAASIRVPRTNPHGGPQAHGEPGAPSRLGPNGATWADPTGVNGNVAHQDLYQLPRTDPRHPRHVAHPEEEPSAPRPSSSEAVGPPPRKLWHASGGSAGG